MAEAASKAKAAPAKPTVSTHRSPTRSVIAPQITRAQSTPKTGAETSSPAWARLSPFARKAGIRKGSPYWKAQAAIRPVIPTDNTTHRCRPGFRSIPGR